MSEPGPFLEFLGRVAYEFELMRPLMPTYLHLLVSAIFPIYTAAHASLTRPPSAVPKPKKKDSKDESDDEEISQRIETLTPSDAILFPLLAGGTLASLYFILKWLQDPSWLNWILGLYFSQIGLFFAMKFLKDIMTVLRSSIFPKEYSAGSKLWIADVEESCFKSNSGERNLSPFPGLLRSLPLPTSASKLCWRVRKLLYSKAKLEFHVYQLIKVKSPVDILDLLSLIGSCGIVAFHTFVAKPWYLTNFLGFSFCYGSLQFMSPGTGWTGTLILSALFFYDIYFVFYTPMMVTVATKLDVPIKLLFPRPDGCVFPAGAAEGSAELEEYLQCIAKKRTMAMLGLGDIVVPGMMLAFALRFDLYRYYLQKSKSTQNLNSVDKKPTYLPATGNWGERFWTGSKFQSEELRAKRFPKPYFYATIFGYLAGMITTVVVMQVFAHAQPALLYLVPGVLISLWGTALVKGDLSTLWNYSEVSEDEDSSKDKEKKDKKTEVAKINSPDDQGAASIEEEVSQQQKSTEDEKTEAAKINELDKQSKSSVKAAESQKSDRRLFHFSITLPEPKSKRLNIEEANQPQLIEQKYTNGDAHSSSWRQESDNDGPPGKRRRRW